MGNVTDGDGFWSISLWNIYWKMKINSHLSNKLSFFFNCIFYKRFDWEGELISYFNYCTRIQYKTTLAIRGLVSESSKQNKSFNKSFANPYHIIKYNIHLSKTWETLYSLHYERFLIGTQNSKLRKFQNGQNYNFFAGPGVEKKLNSSQNYRNFGNSKILWYLNISKV